MILQHAARICQSTMRQLVSHAFLCLHQSTRSLHCFPGGHPHACSLWIPILGLQRLAYIAAMYLQAVLPEMLRPGTASLTVAEEEGIDQMQAVQPGTQQQQQQARQHSGPYGLLDEQGEDDSAINDNAAPALAHQQESQPQQQAGQRGGPYGLSHDQGGSGTVMEDSAAHQQVSSCFQHIINARSKTGRYIEYIVYVKCKSVIRMPLLHKRV